jgi:uncharacterized protein YehS (DUF1456 family)
MTHNDVLRSFRHALELTPSELRAFFEAGGIRVPLGDVAAMLKQDEEAGFLPLEDELFGCFLDGVIAFYRGKRATDERAPPSGPLTNNRVLRSLRIAFELRDTDVVACMQAAGREVSKAELNALFRREDHRNYQPCGDQFLRTFLRGLGIMYRDSRRS